MSAQQTANSHRLHRELDQLSASNAGFAQVGEAAFEPDSLLDIERQITFEIETFLRLERETDRHLREL